MEIIGRDQTRLHLVLISRDEPPASILPVPRVHTGSEPLPALREELAQTEIEIEEAEVERAELSRNRIVLGLRLTQAQDADERRAAARMTRDVGRIFALQGWVPAAEAERVRALAEARGLAVVFEDPAPGDSPPTLLEIPGPFSGSSALTNFYETPGYRSWDPSLIVFFSFAIFFAMILADAGLRCDPRRGCRALLAADGPLHGRTKGADHVGLHHGRRLHIRHARGQLVRGCAAEG